MENEFDFSGQHIFTYNGYLSDSVCVTCPSFLEVFDVVLLSKSRVENLRLGESETPLILGPAGEILFITEETAVQKAHQATGVLPHFTTQLLESQVWNNNERAVIQRSRIAVMS